MELKIMRESAMNLQDSQKLLKDIQQYLNFIAGDLGGEEPVSAKGVEYFSTLIKEIEQVGIKKAPVIIPMRISGAAYKLAKLDIPLNIESHLKNYAYYYLPVPITLFHRQMQRRGLRVRELEVYLAYNPDSPPNSEKPLSHALFPESKWQNVLTVQQDAELVIDGGLNFQLQAPNLRQALLRLASRTGLSETVDRLIPTLPIDMGASAGATGKVQTRIRWTPEQYVSRRLLNECKGIGQPFANWSFRDLGTLEGDEELILHVVLQVPRSQKTVTVMPLILVDFDYMTLGSQWQGMMEALQKNLSAIKNKFGDQAADTTQKFFQQLDNNWPLRIGGDTVWNLSGDLDDLSLEDKTS